MDYTQYFCKECLWHDYDKKSRGHCHNPNNAVDGVVDGELRACFRIKLKNPRI